MRWQAFGINNVAEGEFAETASVTWTLGGNPAVSPGGSVKISIPDEVAGKPWMQFGHLLATRPHPDLPMWAGMIDTPWEATLPVGVTIYNIEYLLNIRTPDTEALTTGNTAVIMQRMLDLANAQQENFLRLGTVNNINAVDRQETIKQTNLWEQFQSLGKRTATEFVTRPVVENGRLMIYLDIASRQGEDTNYLLFDGDDGNMTINSAVVEGETWNRVIGVGTQSAAASRLQTPALLDEASATRQRLRSKVQQFDAKTNAGLLANTKTFLESSKNPYIKLTVKILNHNHVFKLLRLGNSFVTQASKVRLPGGKRGWKGVTRINTMTFSEAEQSVLMTLIGAYNG
jgi:hypothetical protein